MHMLRVNPIILIKLNFERDSSLPRLAPSRRRESSPFNRTTSWGTRDKDRHIYIHHIRPTDYIYLKKKIKRYFYFRVFGALLASLGVVTTVSQQEDDVVGD